MTYAVGHSGQKVPRTRRCIKTPYGGHLTDFQPCGQKAPTAPEGALRPDVRLDVHPDRPPERAPRQKVHEGIYRRAPAHRMPIFTLVRQNLDILPFRASSRSRP